MRTVSVRPARLWAVLVSVAALALTPLAPVSAALPATSTPQLSLDRLIRTSPFVGTTVSMTDNEGSTYVPRDGSLWLANDDGRRLYEVNPATGALKRSLGHKVLSAATQYGGGPVAGLTRDRDLESMAYDASTDTLYAFAGNDQTSNAQPAVFRLGRVGGSLTVLDYQPLPQTADPTAAAWNPVDGTLYVGVNGSLRTYDYRTNRLGPAFSVPGLTGILGMEFTPDGKDLFVTRDNTLLSRVDWTTRSLVPGWTFDLTPFGMLDTRAVSLVGDQLLVSDGYDFRTGEPTSHAVFVFDVATAQGRVVAPKASFTVAPAAGSAPLRVSFSDTSAGAPTGWVWNFGDGSFSNEQNPVHTYRTPGRFTVRLTVSNSVAGSSTTTVVISRDTTAPRVSLAVPSARAGWSSSWQRVHGRATDALGSGVRVVQVRAIERHGAAWWAYRGPHRGWAKVGGHDAALSRSATVQVVPDRRHRWNARLVGVSRGHLELRVVARDRAGNLSAPIVHRQRLTR